MKTQTFKLSTHWLFAFLLLLAGGLSFTSCDLLEDDDDEDDTTANVFSKNFTMKFTRCERVGSVLQIDWQLTNKSGKDLQNVRMGTELADIRASDNAGKEYSWGQIAIGEGTFGTPQTVSILKNETIKGTFRFKLFDPTNSATRVNVYIRYYSAELGLDQNISFNDLTITDNRVLANGIQTNDLKLTYALGETTRDENNRNVVYTRFSVTNNTGRLIRNFYLKTGEINDNLGKYCHGKLAIGEGTFSETRSCDIAAGATETFYLAITDFSESATSFNASISCQSDNTVFVDDNIRFFNIRVN